MYVFSNRDHQLYAVDREDGSYKALGGEVKLQGERIPSTWRSGQKASCSSRPRTWCCSVATDR